MNNLREELLHQHAWLDQALNDLACAAETVDDTGLLGAWSELERGILQHLDFEEQELFPLVAPFHTEGVNALRAEHDGIRKVVTDLGVRADLHNLDKTTVDDFVEMLRRHVEHEDRTLYHWVEEHAPEDTRRHLFGLFVKTARADIRSS